MQNVVWFKAKIDNWEKVSIGDYIDDVDYNRVRIVSLMIPWEILKTQSSR